MAHLAVKICNNFLALPEDASIDLEDVNPFFNDGIESYSYSFEVPLKDNRSIFDNLEDVQSDNRLVNIENEPMSILVDNVTIRNGKVATSEDQELKDSVSISMTSNNKSLSDLYGDLTCQDIPLPEEDKDDLQIGEMIGDVCVNGSSDYNVSVSLDGVDVAYYPDDYEIPSTLVLRSSDSSAGTNYRTIQVQALGFSSNKEYECSPNYPYKALPDANDKLVVLKDFINTNTPFGQLINQPDGSSRRALYFNSRISYIHHKKAADGTSSDETQNDKSGYGPYYVLEADRPQSGVCFYILYFFEALFKYLGLLYDQSAFNNADDIKRLAFFTTKCKYDLKDKYTKSSGFDFPFASDFDDNKVNIWLSSRNTNGSLSVGSEKNDKSTVEKKSVTITFYKKYYPYHDPDTDETDPYSFNWKPVLSSSVRLEVSKDQVLEITFEGDIPNRYWDGVIEDRYTHVNAKVKYKVSSISASSGDSNYTYSANVKKMYANSDNFPEMSISSLVESMWGSFGIKFYLDQETNTVTPYFIRDIFRDPSVPIKINGEVYTAYKHSEKITGFRMRYSNESDKKEQNSFIRKGVSDYDTSYDYQVEKNAKNPVAITSYYDLAHGVLSVGDTNCYVDTTTGNAYRIKVNKDALDSGDINNLQPALFQVAQFHGVEIGDCSDDNEDFIKDVTSEFAPLDMNDINYNLGVRSSKMCPFSDEDMWNEKVDMGKIKNVVDSNLSSTYYIEEEISTDERYDVSGTDDGNSPLQFSDWGNSVIMMRGGGSDASIEYYDYNYDDFGNCKWRFISGDYAVDCDSISIYGEDFDYNGSLSGIGMPDERISLKIRAFHTDKDGNMLCDPSVAYRGLYDTFMSEYAHFLLNRKKVTITADVNVADLQHIDWKKRYNIGGYVGWINKINTHITMKNGIESVSIEMFIL